MRPTHAWIWLPVLLFVVSGCAPFASWTVRDLPSRESEEGPALALAAEEHGEEIDTEGDAGAQGDRPFDIVDDETLAADFALDEPEAPSAVPATATARPTEPPTLPPPTATPLPSPTLPPTPTADPFVAAGAPVRFVAPSIGVDALVEQVGLTSDRAMDVPQGWHNVGWYREGYRPGESGNAVIAGHLDTTSGGPAVFWALDQLLPGDEVQVHYENGDRYTFVVQDMAEYDWNAEGEVIDRIFGPAAGPSLNLITCQGAWDYGQATYSKRLVVFTELVPELTVRAGYTGAYD